MAKNHSKIIRVLVERQEEELNISKLSKYSGIDYKNVHSIVKDLENKGLIVVKAFGKTKKITLIKKVHPLIFETEYLRREELLNKDRNLLILYKRLSELDFPFIALLFGSYAKGKATKHSDIDLLIISNEKESKIQEVLDLFPLRIHPTFISFENFRKVLKTKEFSVISEAIKNNIILIGIEEYYRMVENVK